MEIQDYIERAKPFTNCPEHDYVGREKWINDGMKQDFFAWRMEVLTFLQTSFGKVPPVVKFEEIIKEDEHKASLACLNGLLGILGGLANVNPNAEKRLDDITILEEIFEHFHRFSIQLSKRHANRSTVTIKDEYDVQDLLHAVLRLHFDDVRPEEWVPSYAGGNKRMDFLLKESKIAIEVKMTRDGLKDKEIGEQLLIDIANYKQHPDVDSLYCFVYDKDNLVYNPVGLETDLEKESSEDFQVKVFVRPN